MKLIKRTKETLAYELSESEALALALVLRRFPILPEDYFTLSRTADNQFSDEDKALVHSELIERRGFLLRKMGELRNRLENETFSSRLELQFAEREMLLQVLNDVRVGCWVALGRPESMDKVNTEADRAMADYRYMMDLSGFFQMALLESL